MIQEAAQNTKGAIMTQSPGPGTYHLQKNKNLANCVIAGVRTGCHEMAYVHLRKCLGAPGTHFIFLSFLWGWMLQYKKVMDKKFLKVHHCLTHWEFAVMT